VCGQQPLNGVQRAAGHAEPARVDAVGAQPPPRRLDKLGEDAGVVVPHGRERLAGEGREVRTQVRQQAGVRRARGQVERPGGHGEPQRRPGRGDRWAGPDAGAVAAGGVDDAALAQRLVGLRDGAGADAERVGEHPDRRQGRARQQAALADPGFDVGGDLGCRRPGDLIMYWHSHSFVL
jgi:hypothetical protein